MPKIREKHTLSLELGLYEDLKKLSEATRIPISRLIDESLEDLFNKHNVDKLWEEHKKKLKQKEERKQKKES